MYFSDDIGTDDYEIAVKVRILLKALILFQSIVAKLFSFHNTIYFHRLLQKCLDLALMISYYADDFFLNAFPLFFGVCFCSI